MVQVGTAAPIDEGEGGEGPEPQQTRFARMVARIMPVFVLVVVLGLGAVVVAGAFEVWPDTVSAGSDPSWLDNIFASKTVLFGARVVLFSTALVLFVGAAFTIWSIGVRWQNKQLLRRIGPFEISDDAVEAVSALKNQIEELRIALDAGEEEISSLRDRLAETEELADHFYGLWEAAIEGKDRHAE